MAFPAFTSVATRRSLNPPVLRQPPSPPRSQKINWPVPVRAFVQRSFAVENAIDGVSQDDMRIKLKEIIDNAAQRDALSAIDWNNHELPQQTIQRERQFSALKVTSTLESSKTSVFQPREHPQDTNSKAGTKRKSTEAQLDPVDNSHYIEVPPWRNGKSSNVFERASPSALTPNKKNAKKQKKLNENEAALTDNSKLQGDLEKRKMRFENGRPSKDSPLPWTMDQSALSSASGRPVVGTCQDLEKRYFRLTAPPKPETVRPLPVLRRTLDHLKRKWRMENNYGYICDQFKSLRQDLTVQHIKNDFTVNCYEIHARIALEKGDLGEYNQCQTQLRALYKQKLGGHPGEFMAYRILYFIYTCNRTDMNAALADLTPADHKEPAVKHALQTRSALALGNYHRFFRLYLTTPNMGAYLMDMFIGRERLAALANICKVYKPDVALEFLSDELAFDEHEQCCSFICDHGGEGLFETRQDGQIVFSASKAGAIFDTAKSLAFRRVDIKGQI